MPFAEPRFRLRQHDVDDVTAVVDVSGEVHVSTATEFGRRLNEAIVRGHRFLALDLTDVTFIDSTGLSVLLNALRRVTRAGGKMAIVCTNPTVLRLFEITRLDSTFMIFADLSEALRAVQPAAGGSTDAAP